MTRKKKKMAVRECSPLSLLPSPFVNIIVITNFVILFVVVNRFINDYLTQSRSCFVVCSSDNDLGVGSQHSWALEKVPAHRRPVARWQMSLAWAHRPHHLTLVPTADDCIDLQALWSCTVSGTAAITAGPRTTARQENLSAHPSEDEWGVWWWWFAPASYHVS